MKMSVRALKPRIDRLSPAGTPPSPAWMLMPVTLRSTSRSVVAPCASITDAGTTVIVCGMSRSGSVNLGEVIAGPSPVTEMNSPGARKSSVTVFRAVKVNATLVPDSTSCSACLR